MTPFTIADVRVFTGSGLSDPSDVVVSGTAISEVRPRSGSAPTGDIVEGRGTTLLPGLIDTHVHLDSRDNLDTAARHGVTTMVDLGTHPASLVDSLRHQRGLTDIRSAGSAASAPGSLQSTVMGFPADSVVTGPDDAQRYLDWRVGESTDLIKIIIEDPQLPDSKALAPETIAALVSGARTRGLQTVAHVVTAYAYRLAADAGVDVLTHAPVDRPIEQALIDQLLGQGTVVSPTLIMMKGVVAALGQASGSAMSFDNCLETVRRLHTAGVPIVAGTDAHLIPPFPFELPHGSSLHDELGLLVEAGLTPAEALSSATAAAAEHFRLPDRGTVAAGKRADLILVDGDPLTDIDDIRRIRDVWCAGARYQPGQEDKVSVPAYRAQ